MEKIITTEEINQFLIFFRKTDWTEAILKTCILGIRYLHKMNSLKRAWSLDSLQEEIEKLENENRLKGRTVNIRTNNVPEMKDLNKLPEKEDEKLKETYSCSEFIKRIKINREKRRERINRLYKENEVTENLFRAKSPEWLRRDKSIDSQNIENKTYISNRNNYLIKRMKENKPLINEFNGQKNNEENLKENNIKFIKKEMPIFRNNSNELKVSKTDINRNINSNNNSNSKSNHTSIFNNEFKKIQMDKTYNDIIYNNYPRTKLELFFDYSGKKNYNNKDEPTQLSKTLSKYNYESSKKKSNKELNNNSKSRTNNKKKLNTNEIKIDNEKDIKQQEEISRNIKINLGETSLKNLDDEEEPNEAVEKSTLKKILDKISKDQSDNKEDNKEENNQVKIKEEISLQFTEPNKNNTNDTNYLEKTNVVSININKDYLKRDIFRYNYNLQFPKKGTLFEKTERILKKANYDNEKSLYKSSSLTPLQESPTFEKIESSSTFINNNDFKKNEKEKLLDQVKEELNYNIKKNDNINEDNNISNDDNRKIDIDISREEKFIEDFENSKTPIKDTKENVSKISNNITAEKQNKEDISSEINNTQLNSLISSINKEETIKKNKNEQKGQYLGEIINDFNSKAHRLTQMKKPSPINNLGLYFDYNKNNNNQLFYPTAEVSPSSNKVESSNLNNNLQSNKESTTTNKENYILNFDFKRKNKNDNEKDKIKSIIAEPVFTKKKLSKNSSAFFNKKLNQHKNDNIRFDIYNSMTNIFKDENKDYKNNLNSDKIDDDNKSSISYEHEKKFKCKLVDDKNIESFKKRFTGTNLYHKYIKGK